VPDRKNPYKSITQFVNQSLKLITGTNKLLCRAYGLRNSVLFCRTKRVRYSDIVGYSDVKEDVIELPRVFAESRDELLVTPSSPLISDALPFGRLRYGEPDAIETH
jgi:hypothetical protein